MLQHPHAQHFAAAAAADTDAQRFAWASAWTDGQGDQAEVAGKAETTAAAAASAAAVAAADESTAAAAAAAAEVL